MEVAAEHAHVHVSSRGSIGDILVESGLESRDGSGNIFVAALLAQTLEQLVQTVFAEVAIGSKEVFEKAFKTLDAGSDFQKVQIFSKNVGG